MQKKAPLGESTEDGPGNSLREFLAKAAVAPEHALLDGLTPRAPGPRKTTQFDATGACLGPASQAGPQASAAIEIAAALKSYSTMPRAVSAGRLWLLLECTVVQEGPSGLGHGA